MSAKAISAGFAERLVDGALEATVAGSFSRVGVAIRRRLGDWAEPTGVAGRTIVVTGATSGIGLAAARRLARDGASLCLVGRDAERLERARADVAEVAMHGRCDPTRPEPVRPAAAVGDGASLRVTTERADLEDLESAAALGKRLADKFEHIDVLVHNAGALHRSFRSNAQGIEATVALHVLAPFILTEALLPALGRGAPSLVVTVTSGGLYSQRFRLDQLESPPEGYDGVKAYGRAKRAQLVLTHEWQRRYGGEGICFAAMHPGWADTPGLESGLPGFRRLMRPLLRTADEGAETAVWLAGSDLGELPGGRLWLDRRPRTEHRIPWTWEPPARQVPDGSALFEWCAARRPEPNHGAARTPESEPRRRPKA